MLNSIKKFFGKTKREDQGDESGEGVLKNQDIVMQDRTAGRLPRAWIGVDLDGTLAHHDSSSSYTKVGRPVPDMLLLVKRMINHGIRIKIFTARAEDPKQHPIIQKWLKVNGLPELEITNVKDFNMIRLYDDRCIQVERNTGRLIVEK